jgi:hypothetical protein
MRFELAERESLDLLCAKPVSMAMTTICTEVIKTVVLNN